MVPSSQAGMAIVLLGCLFVIVRSLLKKSGDRQSPVDLDFLVLEWNPRSGQYEMSIIRCLALGAFVFTIWLMVALTMRDKMTEGYMGLFNLTWVGPLLAQIIWGKRVPPEILAKLGGAPLVEPPRPPEKP